MTGREDKQALFDYILRLGDNALILGQRLAEWCGHGPELEEDIALTNVALDFIGQARALLSYAAKVEGKGRSEDDLAFLREERAYKNALLTEQPNEDFGRTIARQFIIDAFNAELYAALSSSSDGALAAIAEKSLKEVKYHFRHSAEWVIRLGDGTEESHRRIQAAFDDLWAYTGELFAADDIDRAMLKAGIGVDLANIKTRWDAHVDAVLTEATLTRPRDGWMQSGGRQGRHSEHLGHLLSELQYMQRTYPGARW
jgi:ring-1,2-phenylacetyl-CoA epoxidase subunit PaaC